jgi:Ser/Thr protein kinase RdoA (MazF antagonist)
MVHTHDVAVTGDVVRKTYVSWDDGEPEREWAALRLLSEAAPGLAPEPIGRESHDGRPVVVMSRLPGEPLAGDITPAQHGALVEALRRLFAVRVPDDVDDRAHGPQWMRRRSNLTAWLAEGHDLDACLDPALVRTATIRATGWLDTVRLPGLVDRVVALGDGNLDNVLWDGEVCRLIDWEEYGASDLAYEVADLVEHASSRLTHSLDVEGLLADLGLDEPQRERVEQHRRLFACFWLMMLLPGNGGFVRNPQGSTEDQARHVLALLA